MDDQESIILNTLGLAPLRSGSDRPLWTVSTLLTYYRTIFSYDQIAINHLAAF
ncbi:hypothetical protein CLV98_12522 [Dyadobacter jejuensis]|uniref:Uncharacterized protein n=1 Tax=Dyadobacter jejuensis TaxID=1082580 RepID=A0A316A720_9BACT|nr:hypothetical protein CLV98_12522 [Dyadobacter jejuensis]